MRTAALVFSLIVGFSTLLAAEESPDAGSEKYLLQYKFKIGEVLRYRVTHSADIRSSIEGTSQEAETRSESIKAWKVTDVLPSGEMEFVHVVESVRMSNRVPNRALVEYDSEQDQSPPPGFEQAARAVGVPLSVIRINPSGEIVEREEKHPQPPATEDLPITLQLPAEPIAVGQQWDMKYDVDAQRKSGGTLSVRTRRLCTLRKVEHGIATIDVDYQLLTPVSPYIESQLVQRLTRGTVRFNIEDGRIHSQSYEADRRVIGFAGKASSMHYVSRMEEELLDPQEKLAAKPQE